MSGILGEWDEIYTSGNSVNPLDYGLGSVAAVVLTDFNDAGKSGFYYGSVPANAPKSGSLNWSLMRNNIANGNQGVELSALVSSAALELWFRTESGVDNYSDWAELYHSENTNFNEMTFINNDFVGPVVYRTSTTFRVVKDISGHVNQNPASVTITGTFSVKQTSNGTN